VNTGAKPLNSVPRSGKLPSSPSQDHEISSTSLATAGDRARHVAIAPYLPASTFQTLSPTARSRPICQSTAIRASPPIRLPLVVSLVWWCPRIGNHHWFSCAPICRSTPTPGSPEDKLIVESLGQDIDRLDIVRTLRKQSFNLHADAPISGAGSGDKSKVKGWVELAVDPTNDQEGEAKTGILDALSGTRGFGVQRAFWNAETREMVAVVWIGVAHGGAIATIFEETMARMVRGPSGAVGMYTIQTLSALSSTRSK
jgi:hypothetical protein